MEHIEIANIQRMKLHFWFGRRPVVMLRRGVHASKQLFYVVLCAGALITAARCETNELRETSADHAVIIASKSSSRPHTEEASSGSAYIPNDSWIYPAMLRLYSLGYVDTIFLSMRPWARVSVIHALLASHDNIVQGSDEAKEILAGLERELSIEMQPEGRSRGTVYGFQSLYTRILGIAGTPLRDSYHLGQTIVNDYGRPYQEGFNNVTGFSTLNETGRFSLYVRGEYQHSPAAQGYSLHLAENLSTEDQIPYAGPNTSQATIPAGPIAAENTFQLQEAVLSVHFLGHEISGGKSDAWFGPAVGGSLAWSNNAENIYSFRINRVEPLNVYLISKLLGPMRYDFFIGSLKGHTSPNSPWVHAEMFAFRPTNNFEFGFERTIIWGGVDHAPVTMHTFLHGFFDIHDTTGQEKISRNDPGARFSDFNFSWRLPYVRRHLTLYVDSLSHDDVTPISAPRRAAYRPGIYLSQFPGLPRLDLRVEGATTDEPVSRSTEGLFTYWEGIQRQGYTNKGFIMGDWIGREAKGGQAWLTYHLSSNEWLELQYLTKKTPNNFIAGGVTQNSFTIRTVKRLSRDIQLDGSVQYERWNAPIYRTGQQNDVAATVQFTWFPKLRQTPGSIVP
jgi:Capsule assembly protein Wzi